MTHKRIDAVSDQPDQGEPNLDEPVTDLRETAPGRRRTIRSRDRQTIGRVAAASRRHLASSRQGRLGAALSTGLVAIPLVDRGWIDSGLHGIVVGCDDRGGPHFACAALVAIDRGRRLSYRVYYLHSQRHAIVHRAHRDGRLSGARRQGAGEPLVAALGAGDLGQPLGDGGQRRLVESGRAGRASDRGVYCSG